MFWMSVPSVLADTSSMTSLSSPVDLFSISHSRTSSSRDSSSKFSKNDECERSDYFFGFNVSCVWIYCQKLTLIDDWRFVTIVNESWQFAQVVFVGEQFVMDLYEANTKLIGLIIDIFQLLQCFRAFATFRLVWCDDEVHTKRKKKIS